MFGRSFPPYTVFRKHWAGDGFVGSHVRHFEHIVRVVVACLLSPPAWWGWVDMAGTEGWTCLGKTDARCALTWAGWKPYGAVSPTAKGFPKPSHPGQPLSATLGDPMQPGTQGRSSRMAAGTGNSVADKETSPTEARPTHQQRAVREKKPTEPDENHLSNPAPKSEGWEDPFDRSVTQ